MSEYKRLTDKDWKNKYAFGTCSKSDGECDVYKDCFDMVQRLAELEDEIENGTLVRLPFKLGDAVWVVEYDEGEIDDVCSYVFIGGNKNYAFLSPTFYSAGENITTANDICYYCFEEYVQYDDYANIAIYPYEQCFSTRAKAETRLRELKGE